jgi:hypothetical protein
MKMTLSAHEQALADKNQGVANLLEKKYGAWLGQRFFEVTSAAQSAVVTVKVTLRNADKSFFYPIEGRIQFEDQDLKAEEARDFLLDYIDAYIEEFLTGGEETYLPIDWADYDCQGLELQLRGQILNIKLEELADQLLSSGTGQAH